MDDLCILWVLQVCDYLYFEMRKNERRFAQSEQDDKLQSRIELKNKLNFVTNQFSISRLTDSINEHQKLSNLFPEINQPTLDLQEQPITQLHPQLKHHHLNTQQYGHGHDGVTLRHQEKAHSQIIALQQRNEELVEAVKTEKAQVLKLKKKNDKLMVQLDQLKRSQWQSHQKIEKQERIIQQLSQVNHKQDRDKIQQSKHSINNSIDSFCPELLSPEETVQLLEKLLKKVSKSVKMIRRLSNEGTIHQIIQQIYQS